MKRIKIDIRIPLILLVLITLGFTSKINAQNTSKTINENSEAIDTIPYATLYVYRPREFTGSLLGLDLQLKNNIIDGLVLGKVMNNRKMVIKLYQTGKNELFINTELTRSAFINVKMGESYYLKVTLASGYLTARPVLQLMEKEQGQMDFESIEKYTKPKVE